MTCKSFYRNEFPSTFESMIEVVDQMISALVKGGWVGPEEEPCTRLCLEEALVNAIRHGNDCDATRAVGVNLSDCGDECKIQICDQGGGFHPEEIVLPKVDKMGGRGICLIRHFMDRVAYNPEEKCLEMVFRRKSCRNEEQTNG